MYSDVVMAGPWMVAGGSNCLCTFGGVEVRIVVGVGVGVGGVEVEVSTVGV